MSNDQPAPTKIPSDMKGVIFLMVLFVGSLFLNVVEAWKVKLLEASVRRASQIESLAPGTVVPTFTAFDLEGKKVTIDFAGHLPTVLYVFVPSCPWCARNLPNIQSLVHSRRDAYRFIGISLSDLQLKEYLAENSLGFPVYTNVGREVMSTLRLANTPQTLVVSTDGKVLRNWVGAYGEGVRSEIESFFDARLPGLTKW